MGIDVDYEDLGRQHGKYLHDQARIVLNVHNTAAQMLSSLAHEVGHAIHGDRTSTTANESRADRTGASLIITPHEYSVAETEAGHHPGAIARHLEVTRRLVIAWCDWYRRNHPLPELELDDLVTP
jgi:hypothetical protein